MQNYFMRLTKENVLILKFLFKEKENVVQNQRDKPKVVVQLIRHDRQEDHELVPPPTGLCRKRHCLQNKEGEEQKSKK